MLSISKKKQMILCLTLLLILLTDGFSRALRTGANDFNVFYYAWHLVWEGRGAEIYQSSPDRFLYSPGFAWMLAPLGGLSYRTALLSWCFLKVAALCLVVKLILDRIDPRLSVRNGGFIASLKSASVLAALCGVLYIARPLLIDFQYGQVNVFIMAICAWAAFTHLDIEARRGYIVLSWFFAGMIGFAKIFPLPILLLPWWAPHKNSKKKLALERKAVIASGVFTVMAPALTLGWVGAWRLLVGWKDALVDRGLPLDSHNQSFFALLFHYLSGTSTPVIAEGRRLLFFGVAWLSKEQIVFLGLFWSLVSFGFVLAWIARGPKSDGVKWVAILVGSLIIPSHLVWKPYFVMSLPMAIVVFSKAYVTKKKSLLLFLVLLAVGVNLTGFDVIGHRWGAYLEAGSSLLICHLVLMGLLVWA